MEIMNYQNRACYSEYIFATTTICSASTAWSCRYYDCYHCSLRHAVMAASETCICCCLSLRCGHSRLQHCDAEHFPAGLDNSPTTKSPTLQLANKPTVRNWHMDVSVHTKM